MKVLVVTPPYIYHDCSTRKTFWEEKFTGKKQYLFEPVNMRNCGKRNFRKHREIKKGDVCVTYENKYEILKFSEKFGNLDKMETTSSESKVKMEGSGKWMVTALGLKIKARSTKYKMARYDIGNISMKDLVNKIIKFENFVKVPHFKKGPKNEPTLSYLHLVECLRKCMMRPGDHKQHVHNNYEKETASSSDVTDTNKDTDEDESNHSIARSFDEPSSENQDSESDHNYVNATTKLNHNEYIKPSASVIEASYYKIFECGRSVLDKLDVTYQKAFTASEKMAPSAPPEEPLVDWNTQ